MSHGLSLRSLVLARRSSLGLAVGLTVAAAGAASCGEDQAPGELDVAVTTARVSARMDPAEGLAVLDVTAELEASVDLRGASVTEVTVQRLPGGPAIDFDVNVRGPQDASSIDLPGGEVVVVRITNTSVTNETLLPLCSAAASVRIVVEAEGVEGTASRDLTVTCS